MGHALAKIGNRFKGQALGYNAVEVAELARLLDNALSMGIHKLQGGVSMDFDGAMTQDICEMRSLVTMLDLNSQQMILDQAREWQGRQNLGVKIHQFAQSSVLKRGVRPLG